MPAGAPRTTSFPPDEMIALGKEMIEWVTVNKPLHLKQWYSIEKMFLYEEWKTFIQRPEFIPYYERALSLVSIQYLDKDSKIREGASHRFMRLYNKDLRESEDEDLDAASARRKAEDLNKPHEISINLVDYSKEKKD